MDETALPSTMDDSLQEVGDTGPCELIDGRSVPMAPTEFGHGTVEAALGEVMRPFLRRDRLGRFASGEVGILTRRDPDRVRLADAVVILQDQLSQIPSRGYLTFVPELVVEVVSYNDRWSEFYEKLEEYLAGGARVVWVIDPRRRVAHVFRPGHPATQVEPGQVLAAEDVLPGLKIPLDALFEE